MIPPGYGYQNVSLTVKSKLNFTQILFLLFIATIPFEYGLITNYGTITKLLGFIVAFFFTLRILLLHKRIAFPPSSGIFAMLLMWSFFSLFWSDNFDFGLRLWTTLIFSLIYWILGYNLFNKIEETYRLILVFYFASLIAALFASIQHIDVYSRLSLTEAQPNNLFGNTLAFGFLCGMFLIFSIRNKHFRFIIYICNLILLLAIINTGSRGSLLGLMGGIAVYIIHASKQRRNTMVFIILTVLALYLIPAKLFEDAIYNVAKIRLSLSLQQQIDSMISRQEILSFGLKEALNALPFGVGLGDIDRSLGLHMRIWGEINPHNNLLRWIADTGLLGLFLFILMYGKLIKNIFSASSSRLTVEFLAGLSFLTLMFIHGLFTEVQFHKPFWLAILITTIIINSNQNKSHSMSIYKEIKNNSREH